MSEQIWPWLLSVVGVVGFILAGRKIWWAWYVNIACQGLWFAYAIISEQYGFFVGAFFYLAVFMVNAYKWTKEHYRPIDYNNYALPIGEITGMSVGPDGITAVGRFYKDGVPKGSDHDYKSPFIDYNIPPKPTLWQSFVNLFKERK